MRFSQKALFPNNIPTNCLRSLLPQSFSIFTANNAPKGSFVRCARNVVSIFYALLVFKCYFFVFGARARESGLPLRVFRLAGFRRPCAFSRVVVRLMCFVCVFSVLRRAAALFVRFYALQHDPARILSFLPS